MMVDNGAVLIHCRTRYCDYPGRLFQYPEDFTTEQLYELRSVILQSTTAVEELRRTHGQRRIVIGTRTHLILGVTAYVADVAGTAAKEVRPDGQDSRGDVRRVTPAYTDWGGRPVYGFFGFVWKKKAGVFCGANHTALCPAARQWPGFPSADSFARMVRQHVLPRWEQHYWEQTYGAAYTEQVSLVLGRCGGSGPVPLIPGRCDGGDPVLERCGGPVCQPDVCGRQANTEPGALKIYPVRMETCMLRQVMWEAAKEGVSVSGCTGFADINSAGRSAFMNITCTGQDVERIVLKHRKHRPKGPAR